MSAISGARAVPVQLRLAPLFAASAVFLSVPRIKTVHFHGSPQ
jgi:hypothetical protein